TAALFKAAAEVGAIAACAAKPEAWAEVGECLGLAYQLADDLCDVYGRPEDTGKPVQRDAALGRPNAVYSTGTASTKMGIGRLLGRAMDLATSLTTNVAPLLQMFDGLTRNDALGVPCEG